MVAESRFELERVSPKDFKSLAPANYTIQPFGGRWWIRTTSLRTDLQSAEFTILLKSPFLAAGEGIGPSTLLHATVFKTAYLHRCTCQFTFFWSLVGDSNTGLHDPKSWPLPTELTRDNGASKRNRTLDQGITGARLCQLSYAGLLVITISPLPNKNNS